MDRAEILRIRLHSQLIDGSIATSPHAVVSRLLCVQAQDYAGATWAVGLRFPGSDLPDVERAVASGAIVRTWPMRGTLHFVAAEDARWMLALLAPRVLAGAAKRERDLALDTATFALARDLFVEALVGGRRLTRPDAMALLEAGGVATGAQRGYHILWRLAQEGLLVVGPMQGRQQTFALLDEWVPAERGRALSASPPREEALVMLAARYFAGHGPATVDDLARWAGIPKSEARAAADAIGGASESAEHGGARYWFAPEAAREADAATIGEPSVRLLPGFDEYMLGYAGRTHQLGQYLEAYGSRVASNGMLASTVIVDGRAVGVWKRELKPRTVTFKVTEFRTLGTRVREGIAAEEAHYARFVGRAVSEEESGR